MTLQDYFATADGKGFLATSLPDGDVNVAMYDRPHVVDDETLAFAMTERLTHEYLQRNPQAVYAFHEAGRRGLRLYLTKLREETEGELLEKVRSRARWLSGAESAAKLRYLVYFHVNKTLPLVM
jgi:hypothetical protein